VQFAVLTLVGFNDVEITPGATRTATFEVTKKQLSFWRQSDRTWNLARGKRDIWIGSDTETKLLEGKLDI
jgi:beta-glucosidase